jgi:SAM-dependent MidA family methyltransferase
VGIAVSRSTIEPSRWSSRGSHVTPAQEVVAGEVRRLGPLPFSEVMRLALYDAEHGFYATGGQAGRRGDFITSPEVGPLFGALLGRYLDARWRDLGSPPTFLVVEVGAGVGTLARTVLAAAPACLDALTYVLVEQSPALRARHGDHLPISEPAFAFAPLDDDGQPLDEDGAERGPRFVSLAERPAARITGVVLANELLDNLPFDQLIFVGGAWREVRIALDTDEATLVELPTPAAPDDVAWATATVPDAGDGARLPRQRSAVDWVRDVLAQIERGALLLLDYADDSPAFARRPPDEWIRTYRAHERGGPPLAALGTQDITVEVALDQITAAHPPTTSTRQAEFLRSLGIDDLVEEGRRIWQERAAIGDLTAIKARSRIREAEALVDPAGLGAFHVLEW